MSIHISSGPQPQPLFQLNNDLTHLDPGEDVRGRGRRPQPGGMDHGSLQEGNQARPEKQSAPPPITDQWSFELKLHQSVSLLTPNIVDITSKINRALHHEDINDV